MDRWAAIANDLLTAATGAGVTVARSFVATGPAFAHACRQIVVAPAGTREVTPAGFSDFGPAMSTTRLRFTVTFVDDCLPIVDEDGNQPAAADVTAAALALIADAGQIHDALLDMTWSEDARIDCSNVTVEDGEPFGPSGGKAGWRWPVAVVLT